MQAKVQDGVLVQFPYNREDLKRDNPRVSFAKELTLKDVAKYGVVPVTRADDPVYDEKTQELREGTPVLVDGTWVVQRVVVEKDQGELDLILNQAKEIAERAALKKDAEVAALFRATPAQINNYIDNNVTDLASAKSVLKIIARAVAVSVGPVLR